MTLCRVLLILTIISYGKSVILKAGLCHASLLRCKVEIKFESMDKLPNREEYIIISDTI